MRKLGRVILGIFLLATFMMASREARADELTCAAGCGFVDNNGNFTTISVPGASSTDANGINGAGDIVGSFTVRSQTEGFFYNGTTYTPIVYPGASITDATGINNLGEIVGYYLIPNQPPGLPSGFVDNGGIFTSITVDLNTYAMGINNAGQVVGYDYDPYAGAFGFVDSGGNITEVAYMSGPGDTYAYGINDNGEVVGVIANCGAPPESGINCAGGFVDNGGSLTTGLSFGANGVNDAGEIVGTAGGEGVVDLGGDLSDFSVPGSTSTSANGINNEGEIVGDYAGQPVPAPEPETLVLLAAGLVALVGTRYFRRWLSL